VFVEEVVRDSSKLDTIMDRTSMQEVGEEIGPAVYNLLFQSLYLVVARAAISMNSIAPQGPMVEHIRASLNPRLCNSIKESTLRSLC
jgi:hypothetical protein